MQAVKDNILLTTHIPALSHAVGVVDGTGVDLAGYGNVSFFINVGDVGAGPGTLDAKLQYSDDNATWYDETGAGGNDTAIAQITAAGEARLHVPNPTHRYYRVEATVGVNAVVFGVTTAAGDARHRPVKYV